MASHGPPLKLLGWKVTAATVPAHLRISLYPKSKTPEGRMVGLSGHPNLTPQDPGREAEDPGSGLPPAQIQTGSWVIWGAHTKLSSQRSSFQGNVFPQLDRSPPWALCGWAEPRIARHVPSDRFVLFWCCISAHIASSGPDTAVGRSGRVSTHMVLRYNANTH